MKEGGFTLVELLIVLGIIVIISSISFGVYKAYPQQNDLEAGKISVAQSMRRAQVLAQIQKEDDDWGVKVDSSQAVVFKGNDYATRDTSYDEILEISPRVIISGDTEFIYTKFTGLPQSTGTVNLSLAGENKTVTINDKGTISY